MSQPANAIKKRRAQDDVPCMSELVTSPIARRIYAEVHRLIPGADHLPYYRLNTVERQALGGHIFPEAERFTRYTGEALRDQAPLFAPYGVDGNEILDRQQRAGAWALLRNHLLFYLQLATDAYIFEQSTAIALSQQVHRQVASEASMPLRSDPQTPGRQRALSMAALVLIDRKRRINNRVRRHRQNMPVPPATPDPGGPRDPAPDNGPGRPRRQRAKASLMTQLKEQWKHGSDLFDPSTSPAGVLPARNAAANLGQILKLWDLQALTGVATLPPELVLKFNKLPFLDNPTVDMAYIWVLENIPEVARGRRSLRSTCGSR